MGPPPPPTQILQAESSPRSHPSSYSNKAFQSIIEYTCRYQPRASPFIPHNRSSLAISNWTDIQIPHQTIHHLRTRAPEAQKNMHRMLCPCTSESHQGG